MKEITITKKEFSDKVTTVIDESIKELSEKTQDVKVLLTFTLIVSLMTSKLQKQFFDEEPKESEQVKEPKHDKEPEEALN